MVDPLHPRFLQAVVGAALADTPVVVIQGARQVGKSTLAGLVADGFPGSIRVTLDDPQVLAVAESDPAFFVAQAGERMLVVDEAQRAPGLILPLKAAVDRDRRPGRFLLTGSADLLHVKGMADSLAGRSESIELKPLSQGEIEGRAVPEDFVTWLVGTEAPTGRFPALEASTVLAGGYPEAIARESQRARRWFTSYVERLADHDARDLHQGGFADKMGALLRLIASGPLQELVKGKLARNLGVAENTLDSYLRLATTMRLVESTSAWSRTARGRVTKRPKVGLNDTGLTAATAGFTAAQARSIGGREYYGGLVEQFVCQELRKQSGWSATPYTVNHFRDLDGLEVDLLLDLDDGPLIAIEVKSASAVDARAWANLERFRDRFPDRDVLGVCLHGGDYTATLHGWLRVLPITAVWQH